MIYLNNAATSWPKAPGLSRAVADAVEGPPGDAGRSTGGGSGLDGCRARLSRLLGAAEPQRIILTANATQALNIALLGFPWKPGDTVITTQAEHNSVLRPLYRLKKLGIINYIALPVSPDGRVCMDVWVSAMREYRPRMAVFTHASNASGAVNDALALARSAKEESAAAVLIDASQTAGVLPVTPDIWGVDMAVFTGHKYLLGPQGTGGLYAAPGVRLDPVYTGGTGIHSDEDEMPTQLPMRLEAGTGNEHSFAGLSFALEYQDRCPVDMDEILPRLHRLEEGMISIGMKVIAVDGVRTPVVSAVSPAYPSGIVGEMLASSYDIICRTGLHCAPLYPDIPGGTLRLSLSRFTTDDEIDETLEALREIHT